MLGRVGSCRHCLGLCGRRNAHSSRYVLVKSAPTCGWNIFHAAMGWGSKPNAFRGSKPNAKLPKRGRRGIFWRVETQRGGVKTERTVLLSWQGFLCGRGSISQALDSGSGLPRSLFCFGVHVIVAASCNVQGRVFFVAGVKFC